MNTPGTTAGNWRWRATRHMLATSNFGWLKDLTEDLEPRRVAGGRGGCMSCRHASIPNGTQARAGAIPSAPRFAPGESISASSRGPLPASICCSSTTKTMGAPRERIQMDPAANRTYHYWHVFVPGAQAGPDLRVASSRTLRAGRRIALRCVQAPAGPVRPRRRGSERLQPRCRRSSGRQYRHSDEERGGGHSVPTIGKATSRFRRPSSRTIIYEMHVRGFTAHPNSGVADELRGTYAGLIEKIPYLQHLGITAVELLPVFQFDAQDCPPGRVNYWGYAPVSFFAPHQAYSSNRNLQGPVDEFRDMVKALHRAGIEVILDVVFNHTAEGDHRGPTQCFRGLDNRTYYILEPDDRSRYANYSGTGNTLNANHPVVRRMILDSLRYWVEEMHVDGFRFDLASILARDSHRPCPGESAGAVGHRVRSRAGGHENDCRSLGRRRLIPGGQFRGRQLERMEWPVS